MLQPVGRKLLFVLEESLSHHPSQRACVTWVMPCSWHIHDFECVPNLLAAFNPTSRIRRNTAETVSCPSQLQA